MRWITSEFDIQKEKIFTPSIQKEPDISEINTIIECML